jgi:aminoglycoside phosphotransferase (APT) family kinase protein
MTEPLVTTLVAPEALRDHLRRNAPQLGAIRDIRRITSGSSNEVFELDTELAGVVILRRPPRVKLSPTAHDVLREHAVLSAIQGSPVPHPSPLYLCADESVIGAPFFVMTRIVGFHLREPFPPLVHGDRGRVLPALAESFIDALAELALVDWKGAGLDGFGRPDGYLQRQVDRWLGQLHHYQTREIPELQWTADWLRRNLPIMGPPGIIHGDYQFLNVLFASDEPPRVSGVLDWEQSTIADPLVDLGWTLGLWAEAGELSPLNRFYGSASQAPEMPRRRHLAERYQKRTGRDISELAFYETLGLFKLACITEGSYARYISGASDSPLHADFEWIVPRLIATAASIARGERD